MTSNSRSSCLCLWNAGIPGAYHLPWAELCWEGACSFMHGVQTLHQVSYSPIPTKSTLTDLWPNLWLPRACQLSHLLILGCCDHYHVTKPKLVCRMMSTRVGEGHLRALVTVHHFRADGDITTLVTCPIRPGDKETPDSWTIWLTVSAHFFFWDDLCAHSEKRYPNYMFLKQTSNNSQILFVMFLQVLTASDLCLRKIPSEISGPEGWLWTRWLFWHTSPF